MRRRASFKFAEPCDVRVELSRDRFYVGAFGDNKILLVFDLFAKIADFLGDFRWNSLTATLAISGFSD